MRNLIFVLMLCVASMMAWADDSGSCGRGVTYEFSEADGKLTISGKGEITAHRWTVYYSSSVKVVVINEGVTSIGDGSFDLCENLKEITIPKTVKKIGERAFSDCSSLENVLIPDSVIEISDYSFHNCKKLKMIRIPSSVTTIGNNAFDGCKSLQEIEIPNSVVKIGEYAFSDCPGLYSVVLPKSVASVGSNAFWFCSSLRKVISEAVKPPMLVGYSEIVEEDNAVVLYVPMNSIDLYNSSDISKGFADIMPIQ